MRIQKIEKNKVFLSPIKDTNVFFETNLSDSKSGMPPKETIAKEEKKIGTAFVTTAVALSDAQKSAVEKRLLETTRYESFEMNYSVDESLIGGMVIRIGDRVVDSSIKTKLYELSKQLRSIQI